MLAISKVVKDTSLEMATKLRTKLTPISHYLEKLANHLKSGPTSFFKMKEEYQDLITSILGVQPIRINSNLVSFQNRDRFYWTNIPGVTLPEDRGISFQDYKETDIQLLKEYKVKKTPSRIKMWEKDCPNVTHRTKLIS